MAARPRAVGAAEAAYFDGPTALAEPCSPLLQSTFSSYARIFHPFPQPFRPYRTTSKFSSISLCQLFARPWLASNNPNSSRCLFFPTSHPFLRPKKKVAQGSSMIYKSCLNFLHLLFLFLNIQESPRKGRKKNKEELRKLTFLETLLFLASCFFFPLFYFSVWYFFFVSLWRAWLRIRTIFLLFSIFSLYSWLIEVFVCCSLQGAFHKHFLFQHFFLLCALSQNNSKDFSVFCWFTTLLLFLYWLRVSLVFFFKTTETVLSIIFWSSFLSPPSSFYNRKKETLKKKKKKKNRQTKLFWT